MYFNQAQHYYSGRSQNIRLIVIHTAEAPETGNTAEAVINYFAGSDSPIASCHYAVDNNSFAQGVAEEDTAFAAPGANSCGIQIEHAGYAGQSAAEWKDAYSSDMLENSAQLVADICRRHSIPAKHVTGKELATGAGICGHNDVNNVYHRSNHYDPGSNFPWNYYINLVGYYLANPSTPPTASLGDEEMNNEQAQQLANSAWLISNSLAPATGRIEQRTAELVNTARAQSAQITALTAAVDALSKNNSIDPVEVQKSIDDAVHTALQDLKVTLATVPEKQS